MKEKKDRRKYTLLSTGLALFLLFLAGGILLFFFRTLKTADQVYTPVGEVPKDAPGDGDEVPPSLEEITGNTTAPESDSTLEHQLYVFRMNDSIKDEFTVDGHTFYRVDFGSSLEPTEEYLSAEDAAQLALSAFRNYFPDQNCNCSFYLHLVPFSTAFTNFSPSEDNNGLIWYIRAFSDGPTVFLHPVSGELVYISCTYADPVYNGATQEGRETPFISLNQFLSLTDPMTWSSRGIKIIREMDLNKGEPVIRYDEESGISYSTGGTVTASFYIGAEENAPRMDLMMDLYTQDFVGVILYENY